MWFRTPFIYADIYCICMRTHILNRIEDITFQTLKIFNFSTNEKDIKY